MRLVQVTVPLGKRTAILDVLDEQGVDYVVTDETGNPDVTEVIHFPLPTAAVEPVLDELRDVGIGDDSYTVIVAAETVISDDFEELTDRYEEQVDENRIAREELIAAARSLAPSLPSYVLLTVISAVIATAGLLLDSPAVVVGSMVIAPLIGPAMAAAVGTVLDDAELWSRGFKLQVLGAVLAVGSAALFALAVKTLSLVPPGLEVTGLPEVRERLAPDFLSLVIALGAGVAGAASLTTGVSAALVGVMIAVALVPPAATVGIGIAWGLPHVVLGSGVLALVNFLAVNLAALVVLWYRGYRPENWFHLDKARSSTLKRVGVLVVAIALLSVFLGGVTLTSVQHAAFEDRANRVATDEAAAYEGVEVLEVDVTFDDQVLFNEPQRVVVTAGRTDDTAPPLAAAISQRLDGIPVEVRYLETTTAGDTTDDSPAPAQVSKGSSGSYPTASMAASRTLSTFSPSVTLM